MQNAKTKPSRTMKHPIANAMLASALIVGTAAKAMQKTGNKEDVAAGAAAGIYTAFVLSNYLRTTREQREAHDRDTGRKRVASE